MSTSNGKHQLDRRVAELIARQHGVLSRDQARRIGLSHGAIQHRLSVGLWEIWLPGVFRAVDVPETWRSELTAACLWCGPRAAISHRAAAAFWALDGFEEGIVEVTTEGRQGPRRKIIVHRSSALPNSHMTRVGAIQVTTVHRTLADLGGIASAELVEQALECALRRRITTEHRLRRMVNQLGTRGRKGPAVLDLLLRRRGGATVPTESVLETRTLQLLKAHGLPNPTRQHVVHDRNGHIARVDLAYRDEKLLIEVDSRTHHLRQQQWERDLARRNELTSRGWLVLHATDEKLKHGAAAFVECVKRVRAARHSE